MSFLSQIQITRATLVAFAGMGMMWGAYAALIPDVIKLLGVSDARFGTLLLATPIAAVTTMLVAPRIAPRLGSHVLPLSILCFGLAYQVPGLAMTPLAFAAGMVMVGVTNAFLDVTMNARVSTLEVDRGLHLMNLNHAAYSFGYAGAAIATGWARAAGWTPGAILAVMAALVMLSSLMAFERGPGINGFAREAGVRRKLGMVPVWGGLIVLISFLSENAAENWSAVHIERTLGAARGVGSFGPALLALTMGFGRLFGQVVIARTDDALLMRWGTLTAAAGMIVLGAAPTPAVAYAGLVIAGLGGSVIAPTAFAAVGRLADPELRAQAIARATALGYLGYFFGPPALGLASQVLGLRVALALVAGVILLVLVIFPRLLASGHTLRGTTVEDASCRF